MTQPHVRGSCYFVVLDYISSLSQRGEFHPLWDLPLCERGVQFNNIQLLFMKMKIHTLDTCMVYFLEEKEEHVHGLIVIIFIPFVHKRLLYYMFKHHYDYFYYYFCYLLIQFLLIFLFSCDIPPPPPPQKKNGFFVLIKKFVKLSF